MKKKFFYLLCLAAAFSFTGCSKESADQCVGKEITSMKEEDSKDFSLLLDEGISQSDEQFVLKFPEELKEPYQEFLQASFSTIDFEVAKAKKEDDRTYTVDVTYTPLDLEKTLSEACGAYADGMTSGDLSSEVSSLLKQQEKLLKEDPKNRPETTSTLKVTKDGDTFLLEDESLKELLKNALPGYMTPYDTICDILDIQDFMTAYLDASFKGELTRFSEHTKKTEEEALAWYNSGVAAAPSDLSEDYAARYTEALKGILKQCKYSVGIPKKEVEGLSYRVDITLTPNNSLLDTMAELEQGTYYSIEEVSAALVQTMEKYAAAPSYGTETTMNVPINTMSLNMAGQDGSDLTALAEAICPSPQ